MTLSLNYIQFKFDILDISGIEMDINSWFMLVKKMLDSFDWEIYVPEGKGCQLQYEFALSLRAGWSTPVCSTGIQTHYFHNTLILEDMRFDLQSHLLMGSLSWSTDSCQAFVFTEF